MQWSGPEKGLLQALIQVAVAMHHSRRGNRAGAASLLCRAQARLESYTATSGGIDVDKLRDEVADWLHALEIRAECAHREAPRILLVSRE